MANFDKYKIDGQSYSRVTSVLDILPKPWLLPWVKKVARESFMEIVNGYHGHVKDAFTEDDVKDCLNAHKKVGREAMDIGTLVHNMTDVWDTGMWDGDYNSYYEFLGVYWVEFAKMYETYMIALTENNYAVLESEKTVYYNAFGMEYAGTLDKKVKDLNTGEIVLLDIKTFASELVYKLFTKKKDGEWKKRATKVEDTLDRLHDVIDSKFLDLKDCRIDKVISAPRFNLGYRLQTEAYRRAENFLNENEEIQRREILYLDKRDKGNYYLEKIDINTNEGDWETWDHVYELYNVISKRERG